MRENTSRQKEIINASIGLIKQNGIQHLTIKNISKAVGITEPAIYRHFENKLEILKGILSIFKEFLQELSNKLLAVDGSSLDKINILFSGPLKKFTENPAFAAVIFSEEIFQNDNILAKEVFTIMEMSQKGIMVLVSEGQKRGEIKSDVSKVYLAIMIMGSLRLLVKKWHLSGCSYNLEKEGKLLWESICSCIKR